METSEFKFNPIGDATDTLGKLESYNIQITDFNGKTRYIVPLGVKRKKLRELFPNAKTEEITKHYDEHSCLVEVRFYLDRNDAADAFVANAHGASNTDLSMDYVTDALSKAYRRLYHNLGLTTLKEANTDLSDDPDVDTLIDAGDLPAPTPMGEAAVTPPLPTALEQREKTKRTRRTKKTDDFTGSSSTEQPASETATPPESSDTAAKNTPAVEVSTPNNAAVTSADGIVNAKDASGEGMTLEEALNESISVYGEHGDRPLSSIFKDKAEVVGMLAQRSLNKGFMSTLSDEEQRSYRACHVIMTAIKNDDSLYDKLKGKGM